MPSLTSLFDSTLWFNAEIALRAGASLARTRPAVEGPTDIFLALVDHYEPQVGQPTRDVARERVEDWLRRYPALADRHRDCEGRPATHSFFYPWDEYDDWECARISELCAGGWGELEVHLHHRDDTEETLRRKLKDAVAAFRGHGAFSTWPDGRPAWGFVHGNWALANSRHDGGRNYCGVNNEVALLQQEGCYADFTFPAWGHTAQPRRVNRIYYAQGDGLHPKSYETGEEARVGRTDTPGLLLVQGPLVPFLNRKGGRPRPGTDDGDLAHYHRYTPERLDRWIRAGIHLEGRPDRLFIKLHTHGAQDKNRAALLGEDLDALYGDAEARYNDGRRYRLHYVTARELFNVIKATEAGVEDLTAARDWLLPPPAHRPAATTVTA